MSLRASVGVGARWRLGLLAAVLLPGCGFRLQGHTPLPESIRTAYVEATDQQTDFVQSLRKALLTSGARPPAAKEQASAVVSILKDQVTRRTLSVSARNQPNTYEITYTVRFSVSATTHEGEQASEKELLPAQDVAATRSYSFNESLVLAKEHEEAILRQAMAQDLAAIVMRQLSSL